MSTRERGRAGDAELLGRFGDGQAQCWQDVFLEGFAGVRWVVHTSHDVLLVAILIVDQDGIPVFERECQSPVAIDPDGPVVFKFSAQHM